MIQIHLKQDGNLMHSYPATSQHPGRMSGPGGVTWGLTLSKHPVPEVIMNPTWRTTSSPVDRGKQRPHSPMILHERIINALGVNVLDICVGFSFPQTLCLDHYFPHQYGRSSKTICWKYVLEEQPELTSAFSNSCVRGHMVPHDHSWLLLESNDTPDIHIQFQESSYINSTDNK